MGIAAAPCKGLRSFYESPPQRIRGGLMNAAAARLVFAGIPRYGHSAASVRVGQLEFGRPAVRILCEISQNLLVIPTPAEESRLCRACCGCDCRCCATPFAIPAQAELHHEC